MGLLDQLSGFFQRPSFVGQPQGGQAEPGMLDSLRAFSEANPGVLAQIGVGLMGGDPATGFANAAKLRAGYAQEERERNEKAKVNNQTRRWLIAHGASEADADAALANPAILQSLVKGPQPDEYVSAGDGVMFNKTRGTYSAPPREMREELGVGRRKTGLQPIYGTGPDGQTRMGVMADDGTFQPVDTGDFSVASGVEKVDLGTQWMFRDKRTGGVVGYEPKDVRGAEREKQIGKAEGENQSVLPAKVAGVQDTIRLVDELLVHPGLDRSVGAVQGRLPSFNNDAIDFDNRVKQIQGTAFLQAREALRGGGQITDYEGQKAELALVRASQAQDEATFKTAMEEFRDHLQNGLSILQQQAGQPVTAAPGAPQSSGRRLRFNPQTGDLE